MADSASSSNEAITKAQLLLNQAQLNSTRYSLKRKHDQCQGSVNREADKGQQSTKNASRNNPKGMKRMRGLKPVALRKPTQTVPELTAEGEESNDEVEESNDEVEESNDEGEESNDEGEESHDEGEESNYEGEESNEEEGEEEDEGENERKHDDDKEYDEEYNNEEENKEDDEEDGVPRSEHVCSHTCSTRPTPRYSHRLNAFLLSFSSMRESDKRVFTCSGRVLEDLIYTGVTGDPANAGDALDWIIDLSANPIRTWLSAPEFKELESWLPPIPKVDQYFTYACQRYDKKFSITDLHKTAESKPTPPATLYDRNSTFNATYVNLAVMSLLSTIQQSRTNEIISAQGDCEARIWSILLDSCLYDLDNFTVLHNKIAPKVGRSRRRLDAKFLAGGVDRNVPGGVRAVGLARSGDGDKGKLKEHMRVMVKALWEIAGNEKAGRMLQVVGVQLLDVYKIRISIMCMVSRGVFVFQPGNWRRVPETLGYFHTVFDVLQAVVLMKEIVKRTVGVLRECKKDKDGKFQL